MKLTFDLPKIVETYLEDPNDDKELLLPSHIRRIEFSLIKTQEEFNFLMSHPNRRIISIKNLYDDGK